jgi:membrane protein
MTPDSLRVAFTDIVTVTRRAFAKFGEDEMTQRSAALAYYAMFSLFPLLLLSISLIGFMLEAGVPLAVDAQTLVSQAVEQALPQAQELVEQILITTRRTRGGTGLVGLIALTWSASSIFTQARLAFNAVWDIDLPQGLGGVLRLRLISLAMTISVGLLLIISILSDTILGLIARYVTRLPWSDTLWLLGKPLMVASVTVILVAILYRFLPRAALSWTDVWPGAIVAAIGWEALKQGFVWYTTSVADWTAVYGPIAGVIGLLLWLYLSAQVLLFGAEFSAAYCQVLNKEPILAPTPSESETGGLDSALSSEAETWPLDGSEAAVPDAPRTLPPDKPETAPLPPEAFPGPEAMQPGLARGTAVGLVGAGVAGGLALVGLLATGRRLLTRSATHEAGGNA